MHKRLVDWGLCWLRSGGGKDDRPIVREVIHIGGGNRGEGYGEQRAVLERYSDPNPDVRPRQWARTDVDKARVLHDRVTGLPEIQQSLVLQTFYMDACAEDWHNPERRLSPEMRAAIIDDLTNWRSHPKGINKRIDEYNADRRMRYGAITEAAKIRPADFEPIMHLAIRHLIARERGMA